MKKFFKWIGVFLCAVTGGAAYRMGGSGNYPRFLRELVQGLCFVAVMVILGLVPWAWRPVLGVFLGFGLCWLESTYFKPKGTDAKWWNWGLVGLVFGIVPLPWCILTNSHWLGFGIRVPVCMAMTIWWQQKLSQSVCNDLNYVLVMMKKNPIGKDITDEFGRGFINIATLPILLI